MPARKISMRKLKEVLRLTLQVKLPHEQISSVLGLCKGAISKYAKLVDNVASVAIGTVRIAGSAVDATADAVPPGPSQL